MQNNKPQLIYTLAVLEKYQSTQSAIYEASANKPKIVYNSLNKMLQESMLLGSTRYGINFIF